LKKADGFGCDRCTWHGSAIAVDQGHLYTDDRTCDAAGANCTLFFVVLDLATGEEIARTQVAETLPTIGHIFVGDEVFYIATEAGQPQGFLTRIKLRLAGLDRTEESRAKTPRRKVEHDHLAIRSVMG
jgi:hypothetical protein